MPKDTNEIPWEDRTRLEKTTTVVELLQEAIDEARERECTGSFTVLFNNDSHLVLATQPSATMLGILFMAMVDIAQQGNRQSNPSSLTSLLSLLKA